MVRTFIHCQDLSLQVLLRRNDKLFSEAIEGILGIEELGKLSLVGPGTLTIIFSGSHDADDKRNVDDSKRKDRK